MAAKSRRRRCRRDTGTGDRIARAALLRGFWHGRDVAFCYAGILVAVTVALATLPDRVAERVVVDSSTNLTNLRLHPPLVLVLSAFIEPTLVQLWIVPVLIWVYGTVQRWLGRAATVVAAVLGHVGATLFVATVLTAGVAHGRISLSVEDAADVGASYGVVAAAALLAARVPRRWLAGYVSGCSGLLVGALVLHRTFTDLGHAVAWTIGLALALLVSRASSRPAPGRAPT